MDMYHIPIQLKNLVVVNLKRSPITMNDIKFAGGYPLSAVNRPTFRNCLKGIKPTALGYVVKETL